MGVLDEVEQLAHNTPPVDNKGSRFGNPAFRTFYDKIAEVSQSLFISSSIQLSSPSANVLLPPRLELEVISRQDPKSARGSYSGGAGLLQRELGEPVED